MRKNVLYIGLVVLGACAHPQPKPVDTAPVAEVAPVEVEPGLAFDVIPAEAELVIDGHSYGPLSGMKLTNGVLLLHPGVYQVSLKHPGFATWRAEVAVGKKVEAVKVQLSQR